MQLIRERRIGRAVCLYGCSLLLALLLFTTYGEAQAAEESSSEQQVSSEASASEQLEITDEQEKQAVSAAREKVLRLDGEPRIIATSPSAAEICDRLDLDLVGICSTTSGTLPERYQDLPSTGTAMSPDMEIISSLQPDWILSPSSLQSDLQPKYEAIDTDWAFLNMTSVFGMYRSIEELGEIFDREAEADALVNEFTEFYEEFSQKNSDSEKPKVLVLMGLPGSYVIATENSYVGSLVEMAGGENVYAGSSEEFLTVNTEDIKTKEPDVILLAAHALPDSVASMFEEEFSTNDIWKHFDAVQNDRVYNLSYSVFGMSANFSYPEALEELELYLYPESEKDLEKARKQSDAAFQEAEDSDASEKYEETKGSSAS